MIARFKSFAADTDGAVTVDWVVLTALVVGLQVIVLFQPIKAALLGTSNSVGNTVNEYGEFLR